MPPDSTSLLPFRRLWRALKHLGFTWSGPVKGWERDGRGGALLVRKFTSSGVEHKLRIWRFARWDVALVLWMSR